MKTLRVLCLLAFLAHPAAVLNAQTVVPPVTNPPAAQTTPTPPCAPAVPLTGQERAEAVKLMDNKFREYTWKGNAYLFTYYIFAIGAALAAALAGLLLQWTSAEERFKKPASILAFLGAALVTVTTFVDFSANARANKAAANQIVHLQIQVERGAVNSLADVKEKMQEIYEQKQQLGLPKAAAAIAKT